MELEEMKAVWSDLSEQLEQQKKLTDEIILNMTQQQYQARINKILVPEMIGTVVCFGIALLLLINFQKLDSPLTFSTGLISAAILLGLPVFSLRALRRLNNINIAKGDYRQIMIDYTQARQQLKAVQQISVFISFVLMFTILPPLVKIMKGKEMSFDPAMLFIGIPLALIFFAFFTRYVYRCYRGIMRSTDQMLEDLG